MYHNLKHEEITAEEACDRISGQITSLRRCVRTRPPHIIEQSCRRLIDLLAEGPYQIEDATDIQEVISAFYAMVLNWNVPMAERSRELLVEIVEAIERMCEKAEANL